MRVRRPASAFGAIAVVVFGATVTYHLSGRPSKPHELRVFLEKKGVGATWSADKREIEFKHLIDPTTAGNQVAQAHYQKCHDRLQRLLTTTGDTVSDTLPAGVQSFDDFIANSPAWKQGPAVFVNFRDHVAFAKKSALVQRHQLSGLCYIHGPDVVQHYVVAENDPNAGMIDISKLIRDTFSPTDFTSHIFNDEGGNSLAMLAKILEPNSVVSSAYHPTMWSQSLKQFGPALVSHFEVFEDFRNAATFAHHGSAMKANGSLGMHAMALVGARNEGGKEYFLLQNWWKGKQFVEVDGDYLKSCRATVSFIETRQTKIPTTFEQTHSVYAENEMDKGEQYMLEGKTGTAPRPVSPETTVAEGRLFQDVRGQERDPPADGRANDQAPH